MKRVLILKTGSATGSVRVAHGDYDRWFVRSLSPSRARFAVVTPCANERLPRAREHDAVIVTGSPHSVTEGAEWMRRTGAWLLEADEQGVPVLGVCFGHQLLAVALGATVRRSPQGREIGTVTCGLTDAGRADPLFAGLPPTFEVQATHEDEVVAPPPALELLAGNAHSTVQAFRAGRAIRAVQFHPEIDPAVMSAMLEARRAGLEAEAAARGADPGERMRALVTAIRPTPAGRRILENFLSSP